MDQVELHQKQLADMKEWAVRFGVEVPGFGTKQPKKRAKREVDAEEEGAPPVGMAVAPARAAKGKAAKGKARARGKARR